VVEQLDQQAQAEDQDHRRKDRRPGVRHQPWRIGFSSGSRMALSASPRRQRPPCCACSPR
jgi:hypothetical protein